MIELQQGLSKIAEKNLLDLDHNKYLQYYNTSIIIIFTYAVAVIVGFLTKQIDYYDKSQLAMIIFISITFFSVGGMLLLNFKKRIKNIRGEIKRLV